MKGNYTENNMKIPLMNLTDSYTEVLLGLFMQHMFAAHYLKMSSQSISETLVILLH